MSNHTKSAQCRNFTGLCDETSSCEQNLTVQYFCDSNALRKVIGASPNDFAIVISSDGHDFYWDPNSLADEDGNGYSGSVIRPTGIPATNAGRWLSHNLSIYNSWWYGPKGSAKSLNDCAKAAKGSMQLEAGVEYMLDATFVTDRSNLVIDFNNSTLNSVPGVIPFQVSTDAYVFNAKYLNGTIKNADSKLMTIPYGIATSVFDLSLQQLNAGKEIIKESYTEGGIFDCEFTGAQWGITLDHTVHGFDITSVDTGRFNDNLFTVKRYDRSGTKQFFNIECSAAGNWNYANRWDNSNWELTIGGNIRARGARGFSITNQITWDLSAAGAGITLAHQYDFDIGGRQSIANNFTNCTRTGGTLGAGLYDINLGDCQDTTIINCTSAASAGMTHNINNRRAIIMHDIGCTLVAANPVNSNVIKNVP